MKFTTVASVLAMAATAIAAPADVEARGGGHGSGGSCSADTQQVCCNGILSCAVQVLGKNCDGSAYCCQTGAPVVSFLLKRLNLSDSCRALSSTLPSLTVSTSCKEMATSRQ